MKKWIKYSLRTIIVAIPIGFIIGFSSAWNSPPSISAAGSTAVQPLLTKLSEKYNNADLTVQPGGTSYGIRSVAVDDKDIGNSSKNPYEAVRKAVVSKDGYDFETWKQRKMKTITIAWDGIAIVYKPNSINDVELTINDVNISKIYENFSGLKQYRLDELFIGDGNNPSTITKSDKKITAYARTGGSHASGTAYSFANESGFNWNISPNANIDPVKYVEQIKHNLETGSYNSNFVITTNESNVEAWNRFKSENKDSSMIYLSLGFVETNKKLIEKEGFKIAKYFNKAINKPVEPMSQNITSKEYGWFNGLNTTISLNSNDIVKDFIWWLVTDSNVNGINGFISKAGYSPLSYKDKCKMLLDYQENLTEQDSINFLINRKNTFFSSDDVALENKYNNKTYGVKK